MGGMAMYAFISLFGPNKVQAKFRFSPVQLFTASNMIIVNCLNHLLGTVRLWRLPFSQFVRAQKESLGQASGKVQRRLQLTSNQPPVRTVCVRHRKASTETSVAPQVLIPNSHFSSDDTIHLLTPENRKICLKSKWLYQTGIECLAQICPFCRKPHMNRSECWQVSWDNSRKTSHVPWPRSKFDKSKYHFYNFSFSSLKQKCLSKQLTVILWAILTVFSAMWSDAGSMTATKSESWYF